MSSHSETELRRWIQEVAATSEPIELNDVLDWPPVDSDRPSSTDVASLVPLELAEPARERPMNSKRASVILAAAAAIIAVVAFAVTSGDGSNGNDVATEGDEPTTTAPAEEQTTVTAAADEQTTVIAPAQTPAQMATEYWQALANGDREAAIGFVDPTALDSVDPAPFGRAGTFAGVFDWYEAVDLTWQLDECVDGDDGEASCTAAANNAWTEALGVEPVSGTFRVRFSENGIIDVSPNMDFLAQWGPQVFEVFADWVTENHPDDAAIMFDFTVDTNPEILRLYEVNTARFVEAQQTE